MQAKWLTAKARRSLQASPDWFKVVPSALRQSGQRGGACGQRSKHRGTPFHPSQKSLDTVDVSDSGFARVGPFQVVPLIGPCNASISVRLNPASASTSSVCAPLSGAAPG
jgi:hypothetical protein